MDIVLGLPVSKGSDACMVIVDQFSKEITLRPMTSTATVTGAATIFFHAPVSKSVPPTTLITDRDYKFVSDLWQELMRLLKVKCKLISAYYQQADPAKRAIQTIQTVLRLYTMDDKWTECIPFVEIVYNHTPSKLIGFTPDELLYNDPPDHIPTISKPAVLSKIGQVEQRMVLARERIKQTSDTSEKASVQKNRYYHRKHTQTPLKPGDKVFVLLDLHPVRSLIVAMHKRNDDKWGPFEIDSMVGEQAPRLKLC